MKNKIFLFIIILFLLQIISGAGFFNSTECKKSCDGIHKQSLINCNLNYRNNSNNCNNILKINLNNCNLLQGKEKLQCRKDSYNDIRICKIQAQEEKKSCGMDSKNERDICRLTCKNLNINNNCQIYDDFSSGVLNESKWSESTFHGRPFTDEHFVNFSEGVYHVAQIFSGDAETNLAPKKQFIAGDSFSYEVIYNGGSGNHFSQPLINGNYPPTQLEICLASGGCGPIGFWNGVPDLEAQIGKYKITFNFSLNEVKMTAIRPDNITIVNTFTGNSQPYNLTINTHSGHNGLMHFDYDNVIICKNGEI